MWPLVASGGFGGTMSLAKPSGVRALHIPSHARDSIEIGGGFPPLLSLAESLRLLVLQKRRDCDYGQGEN